jgi:hypothetical protein
MTTAFAAGPIETTRSLGCDVGEEIAELPRRVPAATIAKGNDWQGFGLLNALGLSVARWHA